ncbi:MAG TPA: outer membrane beta-barrel protein [Thermoanaerobaculia bacterium]
MKRRVVFVFLLALAAVAGLTPANAQPYNFFEVYGAYYDPGLDVLDNDVSLGLRWGSRPAPNWGWELTGGFFDLNGDADRPLAGQVGDASAYFVDLSGIWFVGGSNFGLLGGIGFATVDVDVTGTTEDVSDDAFTYHFGAFYQWDIGDKFYLKPEIRVRKFEGDTYEKSDTEYAVGFGWRY